MQLSITALSLPRGYYLNHEGRLARLGMTGMLYCGAKVCVGVRGCDGWCGPTDGP